MQLLRLVLWVSPHLALLYSILVLVRQAHYKRFPLFFIYLVFEEVQFAALLITYLLLLHSSASLGFYQWLVVVNIGISSCLQIAVLYEVADKMVLPRFSIAAILRSVMRWTVAILVLLAVGASAVFFGSGVHRVIHAFEVLNFSGNLINLGLLLVLLMFTRALSISWRSLPAGIVLGFGIISSAEMAASSFISALGDRGVFAGDVVRMSAFLVCSLVWLGYILLPEATPQFIGEHLQQSTLELWEQELQRLVEP